MKFNRIVLVVVSLALMLFALAGCGKDAAQDSQKKLNIVATTTMLTDLVKEIGGDHVSVQGLMGTWRRSSPLPSQRRRCNNYV